MRTVFLPQLLPRRPAATTRDDNNTFYNESDEDDDEEDRKVVMSVEIEASGGVDGMNGIQNGFEVEKIEVKVGGIGSGAKAELLESTAAGSTHGAGEVGELVRFPLPLHPLEQYNLLYVISASRTEPSNLVAPLPPPTPMSTIALPSALANRRSMPGLPPQQQLGRPQQAPSGIPAHHRPVSISVLGRPFNRGSSGEKTFLTAPFVSRWNCSLDLSHLEASTSDKRLSLPVLAGVSASSGSTFPIATATATGVPSGSQSRPNSLVAGNKRFSIASLSALSSAVGTPISSRSHTPQPPGLSSKPQPPPPSAGPNTPTSGLPPPPTPAFPMYQANPPILPPSQLAFALSQPPGAPNSSGRTIEMQHLPTNAPLTPALGASFAPRTVAKTHPGSTSNIAGAGTGAADAGITSFSSESILISCSIVPPEQRSSTSADDSQGSSPCGDRSSRGGGNRHQREVKVLEPFSLEVFVFNRSDRVRRFTVGVPEKRRRRALTSVGAKSGEASSESSSATGVGDARMSPF